MLNYCSFKSQKNYFQKSNYFFTFKFIIMKKTFLFLGLLSLLFIVSCGDSEMFIAPTEVTGGEEVNIEYSNPISSTTNSRCWIAIVKKGSPEDEWGVWKYVDDKATSDVLVAPTEAGAYEIRLHDNYPTETNHLAASQEITIK